MTTRFNRIAAAAALTLLAGVAPVWAGDDGVTEKQIVLGQAAALKGPAENLGIGMQVGLNAAFAQVNGSGGVNGRAIELKSVNDGYEPEKSAQATQMLIDKSKVFAMIGAVGTPTAKVAVPICDAAKVPFIGAFTGAELLRSPFQQYVVNLRASYNQETEALAAYLVDTKGYKNVACFFQNDAFGQAGLAGIKAALERRSLSLSATGTYERNTVAIAEGLKSVAAANPDAVVMVGAYKPCAEFIKAARADAGTKNATFCNISFVGTESLLADVGAAGEGVIVSQVVPFPWDTSIPVVKEYQAAMAAANAQDRIGYVSFEGYLVGRFFAQALAKVEGDPTREKLLATIRSAGTFDLGGFTLKFGENDHQGSDSVYLTTFKGGKIQPLGSDGSVANVPTDR
jgi:branched-chain amino acid transport system substrate-binding protein